MKKELTSFFAVFFLGLCVVLGILMLNQQRQLLRVTREATATPATVTKKLALPAPRAYATTIALPAPKLKGSLSVEEALFTRRSRREFAETALTQAQLSSLLWSAQGITDAPTGKRTAPSAYNVYPFTVYVVVRNVTGITPGLYEYLPATHALGNMNLANAGDVFNAGEGVEALAKKTPVVIVLSAALDKGVEKLKGGALTSAYLEGGHIGENLYLEAESLKLATVVTGGGTQGAHDALKLDPAETVVYVVPVGNRVPEKKAGQK